MKFCFTKFDYKSSLLHDANKLSISKVDQDIVIKRMEGYNKRRVSSGPNLFCFPTILWHEDKEKMTTKLIPGELLASKVCSLRFTSLT